MVGAVICVKSRRDPTCGFYIPVVSLRRIGASVEAIDESSRVVVIGRVAVFELSLDVAPGTFVTGDGYRTPSWSVIACVVVASAADPRLDGVRWAQCIA